MDFSKFRANLTALIEARGLAVVDLGAEIQTWRPTTIHRYLSGRADARSPNLMRLADFFDVSLDWCRSFRRTVQRHACRDSGCLQTSTRSLPPKTEE